MNIYKSSLVVGLLATLAIGSPADAQKAKYSRVDPHQAQNFAAVERSAKDPAFKAAVVAGRPDEAKRIIVRNGADPKIIFGVEQPPKFKFTPGFVEDQNGGNGGGSTGWYCGHWVLTHYYLATPPPPISYYYYACTEWVHAFQAPWITDDMPN